MANKLLRTLPFIYLTVLIFLSASCQTFPPGETLWHAQEARQEEESVKGAEPAGAVDTGLQPQLSTAALYRYFTMCRMAWRERDHYKKTEWEFDYFYDEPTNTLALAIIENDILHLIFRSSQASSQVPKNKVDRKYNLRARLVKDEIFPDDKIRAHRGFLEKYHSIRPQLLSRLEKYGPDKPVILLGHSGGAVLASLAFMDLKNLYPDIDLVGTTFGSVRVFNSHGAKWFETYRDKFLRIVNGRDPFPNFPPAIFGYRHVGRLIRIGRRPFFRIFSSYDHYRGYRTVLEEMLVEEGLDPKMVLTPLYSY